MFDFVGAIGHSLAAGVRAVSQGIGSGVQAVQDFMANPLWKQRDAQEVQESALTLAKDVSVVKTEGAALIRRAAEEAVNTSNDVESLVKGVQDSGFADPETSSLTREVSGRLSRLSRIPLASAPSASEVQRTLDEASEDMRETAGLLERLRQKLKASQDELARRLDSVFEKLSARLSEIMTRLLSMAGVLRRLPKDGTELARAQANSIADHVVNYGGGAIAGLVLGLAIGAPALTVGAMAASGLALGGAFGRNWRFFG